MALCFSQHRLRVTTASCHRGHWEMTPKMLLLFLPLMAYLTRHVQCESEDINGSGQTVLYNTEYPKLTSEYTSVETDFEDNIEIAGYIQNVTIGAMPDAQVIANTTPTFTWTTTASHVKHHNSTKDTAVQRSTVDTLGLAEQDTPDTKNPLGHSDRTDEDSSILIIIIVVTALALFLTGLVMAVVVLICKRRNRISGGAMKEDPYLESGGDEKVPMPMFEDDVPSVMELEMEDLEKWMMKGDGEVSTGTKQKQFS
ncbi:transmembrane protein 154 [Electrophorus electricus]|uniref:Transmembrane protein 154 n=1 Tax=Electrophorus electricus TaxID=8005 RepID=A0A4W4ETD1_ELEEL|nr:transmembrane protein 154 [Electrophorus electricus]XP_026873700.2 transmembrane protein 154 [Electrophorus electricus]